MSANSLYKHLPNNPQDADNWLEEYKIQADIAANRLGQIGRDTEAAVARHNEKIKETQAEAETLTRSVETLKAKERTLIQLIGDKTTELATLEVEASNRMVAMQEREAEVLSREHAVAIAERRVQISSERLS